MKEPRIDEDTIFDLIVLGYGPVGATLSNLLTQQGLRVAVIEKEAGVYHLARAGHIDAETMRVFQSIGVADKLEPTTETTLASRFVGADGALLMEHRRGDGTEPYGWKSDYMFFQPTLEALLRARQQEFGGATVLLQHEAYAVRSENDHVSVDVEDLESRRLLAVRGRYVVGCDGARSLIRRLVGAGQEDLGFKQRWMVVDVKQHADLGLEKVSTHHCNPDRPVYASVLAQGNLRWEVMLKDTDDVAEVTSHEAIWRFIENSVRPVPRGSGTIARSAVYTFESVLADTWRKGRLLIAGDSAHRTPPFLGQGMCAGIRDAANLAWKLTAVCSGRADDALLDTYATERRPHVRAFIQGAIDLGHVLRVGSADELADRAAHLLSSPKLFAPPDPPLGLGMSLTYGTDGLGRLFPQPMIAGRRMDEHLGHAFALVIQEGLFAPARLQAIEARHPLLRVVALPRGDDAMLQERYRAAAVLLRPDRYVHAVAQSAEDAAAMLEALPVRLAAA